jgi:two-component system CheB/CheR fusion protein
MTRPDALSERMRVMQASPAPIDQLVVIGSSAGVDALGVLFAGLPASLPAAIVVAQHIDTNRPSRLGEVLGPKSELPIVTVQDEEPLRPGVVYVVPSNRHVEISDHHVRVHLNAARRPTPSVDLLFATAAATFGDHLTAVILTGLGSDGAIGAHAVKEAGGVVIIQDPETAAFPSMPRSLEAPLVDAIVPLDRMAETVTRFVDENWQALGVATEAGLPRLLDRLRERRGIDFSAYKTPTIQRRLRRRMAASGATSIADYLEFLTAHPEEEQRLVADFLIKVTRFFRDTPLFDKLRESILPELIATAVKEQRELRLWSAGCATGEEAYSLAILVADLLEGNPTPPSVRIFATDLDESALAFARRGAYPASALADASPELIERYFTERDGTYEITKQIRSTIVFGSHDLGQRPPFPHTDLIMCRNVLIYFTPDLQRRALEIFAYSLRDDGVLVLGKSETPRPVEQLFEPVDRRLRVYRRQGPRQLLLPSRVQSRVENATHREPFVPRSQSMIEAAMRQSPSMSPEPRTSGARAEDVIRRLPVGVAVVTRTYDIELINSVAREYFGIHGAAIDQDVVHLAQRIDSKPLRRLLDRAAKGETTGPIELIADAGVTGAEQTLSLLALPDRAGASGEIETVLLVVTDVTETVAARQRGDGALADKEREAAQLRESVERLAAANRQLLAANRELTDAVDQLREQGEDLRIATTASQVAAEEIETLNEELQSSNEELETLHEEAQATVEELNVANEELQARSVELEALASTHALEQARLSTILASMADAVLVVDRDGRPVRANSAYEEIINSLVSPFAPLNEHGVPLPPFEAPANRVAKGESFRVEFTAAARDGSRRWFEATGRPLHGEEGGVLVIRDITDRSVRRLQEEFLSWAGHELRTPLTALQSYLQMAERRLGDGADDRIKAYLDSAVEQAKRQATLIEELLDATRLRSGHVSFPMEPIDLAPIVEHAAEIAQMLAKGQTIRVDAGKKPVIVNGNAGRLEQVILNLANNAIVYAPGTDWIDMSLERRDDWAEIRVRDHGPGIAPEARASIFERFSRGSQLRASQGSGLGLGLFIVREIVHAHAGEVSVDSTPGEGATFIVRLPLASRAATSAEMTS